MKGWVVVFGGREDEAAAALAALGAAGIQAVSMADNNYLPGNFNIFTTVEVAVPRRYALEAAHVLRVDPVPLEHEEEEESPRSRRTGLAAVAVAVILCMVLLAAFVLLPPAR